MAYATDTEVPVEKSRAELERILMRYGATDFAYMSGQRGAVICFVASGKMVKFVLPLPSREAFLQRKDRWGHLQTVMPDVAAKRWEQACRVKWRALCLCVKAKLEAVESGITSFEAEFLAHFVLPGGQTFGEKAIPQLEDMRLTGKMPPLLLGGGS